MIDLDKISHGCEHELADYDARLIKTLLPEFGRDVKDITIVNSNGIANDPSLKLYPYGGEINTFPTSDIIGQCKQLSLIKGTFPTAAINYRSNLHWHICVPSLKEDLYFLKRFAQFNWEWLSRMLPIIEPIPIPSLPKDHVGYKGEIRRQRRRKRSHHTILSKSRLEKQLLAETTQQFFEAEVPHSKAGQPLWHAQSRAAVNLRQLLQTNTIEFRHFPGTLECDKLAMVGKWCTCYVECALGDWSHPADRNPLRHFLYAGGDLKMLPTFPLYDHSLEIRYRATCHDGTLSKECIAENIEAILKGTFDDKLWNERFNW